MTIQSRLFKKSLLTGVVISLLLIFVQAIPASAATAPTPGKVATPTISRTATKTVNYETHKITAKWKKPSNTIGVSYQLAYRTKTNSTWSAWKTVSTGIKLTHSFNIKTNKGSNNIAKSVQVKVRAINSKTINGKKQTKAGTYSNPKGLSWTVPSLIKTPKALNVSTSTTESSTITTTKKLIKVSWVKDASYQAPTYFIE